MARKSTTIRRESAPSSKFTPERLRAFAEDLKSQRVPLVRQQISDDVVVGLRAICHQTGHIAFHVSYYVDDKRPFMKIGDFDKGSPDFISIEDAREVAKTVKALGEKGIDVQDGLMRRLIRELQEKGTNWRVPK
jgi:hypothetical protein